MSAPDVVQKLLTRVGELQQSRDKQQEEMQGWKDQMTELEKKNEELEKSAKDQRNLGKSTITVSLKREVLATLQYECQAHYEAWRIAKMLGSDTPKPLYKSLISSISSAQTKKEAIEAALDDFKTKMKQETSQLYKSAADQAQLAEKVTDVVHPCPATG